MNTLQLRFFARIRERLGSDGESLPYDESVEQLQQLRAQLAARGGAWADVLGPGAAVMVAINQELYPADGAVLLQPGDEVAFFPPVTGG